MKKNISINFFGGSGCGKSTTASRVFSHLKMNTDYKCELVTEFAKVLTYKKNLIDLFNQIYVFGEQHNMMNILKEQVDIIVTDSPLLLSMIYNQNDNKELLDKLILHEFNKFNNINVLLKRTKPFQQYGRNETEEQAKQIDVKVKQLLDDNNIEYIEMEYPIDDKIDILIRKIEELI